MVEIAVTSAPAPAPAASSVSFRALWLGRAASGLAVLFLAFDAAMKV